MSANVEKTVRELAVENPASTRIFESLGIDYCCGGGKSLRAACDAAKLDLNRVISLLDEKPLKPGERKWATEPLSELIQHIVDKHHVFTRNEINRLELLLNKVCGVHGKNHPELLKIHDHFTGLSQELKLHMMKEEQILFPYICRMEEAAVENHPMVPAPFGTVQHPVRMMVMEHDSAGESLSAIKEASNDYSAPADACISYKTLYAALKEFEADLHQHIHLENNILFPRAIAVEEKIR